LKDFFALSILSGFLFFCLPGLNAGLTCADDRTSEERTVSYEPASQPPVLKRHVSPCPGEACSHLREGRELVAQGAYREAREELKLAYRDLPVMGDYALYLLAKAYAGNGEFGDSNRSLEELLRTYPDSVLKKKARSLEIRNRLAHSDGIAEDETGDNIIKILRQFVTDYPEDAEMKYLLGQTLKTRGEREQAKKIFRDIYISAGPFSDLCWKELQQSDVTPADMLARASNLMKSVEYKKAETLLRKTLPVSGESLRDDVLRKLGTVLFRQKKYHEAATEFSRAGDTYNAARALYRAGDFVAFHTAVSKLVSMKDKRAASLLLALASKKRRDGKIEETLELYRNVRTAYPSHAEEALWGTAWTFYRTGDYEAASKVFAELVTSYPNSRYLYWQAKSDDTLRGEERTLSNGMATPLNQVKGIRGDFYGMLAEMYGRDDGRSIRSSWIPMSFGGEQIPFSSQTRFETVSPPTDPVALRALERFAILIAIGMKEEALAEIMNSSRTISDPDSLLYLGYLLTEEEAYKSAITLATRLSSRQGLQGESGTGLSAVLYPMAYWALVEGAAKTFNLDPFILLSVMREESRFDPEARSSAGALGLMQIMPQTADNLCDKAGTTSNIHDVKTNITIGAYYLSALAREFGSLPAVIAAYNAGEERVREWVRQGKYKSEDEFIEDIPYDETRNYVKNVLLTYSVYRKRGVEDRSSPSGQPSP